MNNAKRLGIVLIGVTLLGALQFACGRGTPPPPTQIPATSTPAPTSTPVPTSTPSAQDHFDQGLVYLERGQLDEAATEFQRAIELDPENAASHRNLGTVYSRQGKLEEAVAAYEEAIEIAPDFGEAYGDMAAALIDLDRIPEAIAAGEKAIELAPDYASAHNNLGIAYKRQGDLEKAIAEYKEATRLDPDLASAHKNLGIVYSDVGRLEEAIEEFETYLRLRPDAHDRAAVEEEIAKLEEMAASPVAEYRNDEGGYSLLYPKDFYYADEDGWSAFSESQEAVEAVFDYATEEAFQKAPLFQVDVMALEDILDEYDLGIAADSTDILEALIDQLGAEIDATQTATLDGYPSALGEISGELEGVSFEGALVIIIVDERVIGVFGLALPEQWDAFFPTYLDMVNSLSFFEP